MAANCDNCFGSLVINSLAGNTEAWCFVELSMLWTAGDQRGADRLIPASVGVQAQQRRLTITRHSLPMVIVGSVDKNGVLYADRWDGLFQNIDELKTTWVDPTGTGDGTRAATLTLPDGNTTRTANIHVTALELGTPFVGTDFDTGVPEVTVRATLEVSLPSGEFT